MTADTQEITALLERYRDALAHSDAAAAAALYAPDGVLMAPEGEAVVGREAIRTAYAGIAGAVALDIRFAIHEVMTLAPAWAFARTISTGTMTLKPSGQVLPEGNQELFLFQRVEGAWAIARYCFNVTLPTRP